MRALLVVALSGCGLADFDVSQPIPEQRIAGSPLPGLLDQLFQFPIDIDIQAQIAAMDTGPVDSIRLTQLRLAITTTAEAAPDTDDWGFLDQADVFVDSRQSGSQLPRVLVATVTSPGAVRELVFTTTPNVNLLPYVNEGARMTAEAEGDAPADDVTYGGYAVFRVNPL